MHLGADHIHHMRPQAPQAAMALCEPVAFPLLLLDVRTLADMPALAVVLM
jgi:hypothetical protein